MASVVPGKLSPNDLPTPDPESPFGSRKPYRFSTLCATVDNPGMKDQYGSSSVPIYQTTTFKGMDGQYDYSRSGNPTRSHLEHHIAKISSAAHAFTVASGMAALDVLLRLLKPGDEVIAGDDLYGGTNRLLAYIREHVGVTVHHVDTTDTGSVHPFIRPGKTAMVLLESPTNPLLKIADFATISKDVKERAPDAIVVVDNTMMSPYLQRPLDHGADIVYDSATKYLSGHHDLMAGAITCNREDIAKKLAHIINSVGNALTPVDSFLLLRGTKTLAIRMDKQQSNAQRVAEYLHQLGFLVHYPGLPDHPGRDIHRRIADGAGAVLSFETGNKEMSEKIVGGTRLWGISVSFGCVNSLISMPCLMSHASIDAATRASRGLPEDLIRLCVGIEDAHDLLDDLERALIGANAITLDVSEKKYSRNPTEDALSLAVKKLHLEESLESTEWLVSAPGKVILFGEHAVVYGVPAIAAAVDLRSYGLAIPRHDGKVSVHLQDLDNFYREWDIDSLPWSSFTPVPPGQEHPEELDQRLIGALTLEVLNGIDQSSQARGAVLAFLYLYMILSRNDNRPAFSFSARSTLPIGAGLGSSASYSVCVATTNLLVNKRISIPKVKSSELPHVSHQGRRAIPLATAEEVNRWAFVGEKILHGNPSGVDNSVSVFGGALGYIRPGFGSKSGMEGIQGFKSLKFLLTNSKIPRDTKQLVASVAEKKANEPEVVNGILVSIQSISDEARRLLADPELPRDSVLDGLSVLMDENHRHLDALGVSHSALENIRERLKTKYSLATKLTGAGGGGCTVSLIPDDFESERCTLVMEDLIRDGFEPYLTSVGGSGLGILSPFAEHRSREPHMVPILKESGQLTPPGTPGPPKAVNNSHELESLQRPFISTDLKGMAEWATRVGGWLYV